MCNFNQFMNLIYFIISEILLVSRLPEHPCVDKGSTVIMEVSLDVSNGLDGEKMQARNIMALKPCKLDINKHVTTSNPVYYS